MSEFHIGTLKEGKCGCSILLSFFFNDTATTEIYTLSLHDALPISDDPDLVGAADGGGTGGAAGGDHRAHPAGQIGRALV